MIRSSQRRCRRKVLFGMAPGVGKTCRMLQEGRERLRDGSDVGIGLLETHARCETARQAEGHRVRGAGWGRRARTPPAANGPSAGARTHPQPGAGAGSSWLLPARQSDPPAGAGDGVPHHRLAAALDAPLLVLMVLDSHRLLSRDEGLRMEQCEQLCARSRRITQIVLAQSRATSLAGLLRRPLSEQLQRQPRGLVIDLHLIGEPAAEPAAEPATEL